MPGVEEAGDIGRDELTGQMIRQRGGSETTQIGVEVTVHRHEIADFEPGSVAPFVQPLGGITAGRVVVARGIEAPRGGEFKGSEVIGREPGDHWQAGQHRFQREHRLDAFAGGNRVSRNAKADPAAEQVAEGAARIGDRGFGGTGAVEPGALDAGDATGEIADGGEQCGPCFERCPLALAVPDMRMEAQGRPVQSGGDAAGA